MDLEIVESTNLELNFDEMGLMRSDEDDIGRPSAATRLLYFADS